MPICDANCEVCNFQSGCKGCEATCGKPFGGACVAAECIQAGGKAQYAAFKQGLLAQVNALLAENRLPQATALHELPGSFVNLAYPLPSGAAVRFLDDRQVYLGTQIVEGSICYGVVANAAFIMICSYREQGADPQLIAYQKRP
jgi:hypothetical protein